MKHILTAAVMAMICSGSAFAADGLNSSSSTPVPMGAGGNQFMQLNTSGLISFNNPSTSSGNHTAWINANNGTSSFNGSMVTMANIGLLTSTPPGWGMGLWTWDVYAEGTVGVGSYGNVYAYLNRYGDIYAANSLNIGGNISMNKDGDIYAANSLNIGGSVINQDDLSILKNLANTIRGCSEGDALIKRGGQMVCERLQATAAPDWVSGWSAGCPSGYSVRTMHANVGNTNNSILHYCVR